jgi:hypothetical protein
VTEPIQTDWTNWHRGYDDAGSRLSRRLVVVQRYLRDAIDVHTGPIRLVSMCAGEGRDEHAVLGSVQFGDDVLARRSNPCG